MKNAAKLSSNTAASPVPGRMVFYVGPREYFVRRRWDLRMDGDKVDGLCDGTNRYIWLDGDLEEHALVGVLRHEHCHAWEMETAAPHNAEERANFTSTVGDAFDAEFNAQGGLPALLAQRIEGYSQPERRTIAERLVEIEGIAASLSREIAALIEYADLRPARELAEGGAL